MPILCREAKGEALMQTNIASWMCVWITPCSGTFAFVYVFITFFLVLLHALGVTDVTAGSASFLLWRPWFVCSGALHLCVTATTVIYHQSVCNFIRSLLLRHLENYEKECTEITALCEVTVAARGKTHARTHALTHAFKHAPSNCIWGTLSTFNVNCKT